MGLATPAAISVGLGRAAKNGILFRNASALEFFKSIRQVVFDKTGTLTTGDYTISAYHTEIEDAAFKKITYSLERFSNHPLAVSIYWAWKTDVLIRWKKIEEVKGLGVSAEDMEGNHYDGGSFKLLKAENTDEFHNVYILKNGALLGWS